MAAKADLQTGASGAGKGVGGRIPARQIEFDPEGLVQASTLTKMNPFLLNKADPESAHECVRWARYCGCWVGVVAGILV